MGTCRGVYWYMWKPARGADWMYGLNMMYVIASLVAFANSQTGEISWTWSPSCPYLKSINISCSEMKALYDEHRAMWLSFIAYKL